ncbi:BNR repeat domain protein [Minicystis rosea]|nr:BNR repeat domain protein [Minicystis rosea]
MAVGASLLSCRAPTEIVVDVTTDIPCASLNNTSITVGRYPDIEGLPPATITDLCSSDGHIGSIVVVPADVDNAKVAVRVVGGKGQDAEGCKAPEYGPRAPTPTGCVVARRLLSFQPHSPLHLPIVLRNDCVGVPCPDDQTCVDGTCKDATVTDPSQCVDPKACDESTLDPVDAGRPDAGDGGPSDAGDGGPDDAGDGGPDDAGDGGPDDAGDGGPDDAGDGGPDDAGDGGSPGPVLEVAVSTQGTSCARTMSGKLYCWGSNDAGKMGLGGASTGGKLAVTQAMPTVPDVVRMGLAPSFFCVSSSSNGVRCAGDGSLGQLGNGIFGASTGPVAVKYLDSGAESLTVGDNHACALIDPAIYCWGLASSGQLGASSSMGNAATPVTFAFGASTVGVAAGGDTTCAWANPGNVLCWGNNADRQLNRDPATTPMTSSALPVYVSDVASSVVVGTKAACAVVSGQPQCWGRVDGSSLSTQIVGLGALSNVSQIALGGSGGCLLSGGNVYCWGANDVGQLGQGGTDAANTFPPVQVPGIADAVHIARSADHVCVARMNGTASCWGDNTFGQVSGDGIATPFVASPASVPVPQ